LIYCYEKQLLADPTIQGLVVATFTIGRDGKVSSSSVSGLGEPAVETCMADTIKGFEFPTARARDTVVSYPISLCPPSRPRRLPPSGMRD
ncbi:MAG: AgmX/PglI C-terminal domain-containing protein, partial [Kofleriaceae bacterium]